MNRLPFVIAASLLLFASPAQAQTMIGKGDAFLLGGEQKAPIRVAGRNSGGVPIEVMAQTATGRRPIVTVQPGDRFDHVFAVGETVVLRNTSDKRRADADIALTRTLYTLSMRYQLPQQ